MDSYKLNWTALQTRIFSLLCIRAGEGLSQREIAKLLTVSPTAVANALQDLKKKKFVNLERVKNINFIELNRNEKKILELKRAENLKNIYLYGLFNYLNENLAGGTIILFGSYSKGEDIKGSDIDIAVIERKEKSLDIQKFEESLNRKINIQFYDSWEIHKNLRNNILNGIILTGSIDI